MVSQCRLVYNFSRGALALWANPSTQTRQRTAQMHSNSYFEMPSGGFCWSVSSHGEGSDGALDAYGHAFCILALATAAMATDSLGTELKRRWTFGDLRQRDIHRSAWRANLASGCERGRTRSQNPLMHMFEALLALRQVDRSDRGVGIGV